MTRPLPSGHANVERRRSEPPAIGLGTVLATIGIGIAAAVAIGSIASSKKANSPQGIAVRRVRQGAAILGASVLADSAMEHYQGSYHRPAMYVAPMTAAATMVTSLAASDEQPGRESSTPARIADGVQLLTTAVGAAGLAFHAYNILKRPGGLSWNNLFYAAPIGAPGALAVAGLLDLGASRLAVARQPGMQRKGGRILAGFMGASLLATTAEVALLHFRGAFHNPAMILPVTIPPAAGVALLATAARPELAPTLTRRLLQVTALLGPIGTAFHAYGVSRNMGGWSNWRQNLLAGPPMPAPSSFTGLALAGLAALQLLQRKGRLS